MAKSSGGEHRVGVPAHGAGQGKGAKPEKQLNCFVRSVALIERTGNALGTLAFTWATVVLLGGYPTVLRQDNDFGFATTIVFLEAARMFCRKNRLDYQLFFHTKGAVRPLGWNGLIVIVYLSNILSYLRDLLLFMVPWPATSILVLTLTLVVLSVLVGPFQPSRAVKLLPSPLRHTISLCCPLVAILLLVPSLVNSTSEYTMAKWIVFTILFLAVLLLTVSRPQYFARITKLAERVLGNKQEFWYQLIMNMCMFVELVVLVSMRDDQTGRVIVLLFEVYAFVVISFGNLQIPAAVARVVLSLLRLVPQDYCLHDCGNDNKTNLKPSLNIFYGMVLGQGILYILACMLEIFSVIPRRSLARRGGFRGQGVECVNLYYAYALEKYMEKDVLAPKKISLNSFAMYSLNSDTPKMQLHGIRIMDSLLRREATRKQLFSKLTTSTRTISRLIEILDWSSPKDACIRLLAAKVTAELATSLRVITIPGTVQVVSALLDYDSRQKKENPLLDADVEHGKVHDPILNASDNQEERLDVVSDTGSLLETQDRSTQQVGNAEQKSWILRCWQRIFNFWSIHHEEPFTDQDLLPALGMSILDGLACCDQENCVEISRASGLIPKIVRFTKYRRIDTMYTEAQWKILMKSSLKLLHSLTSIDGEIGKTLRHKISKNPFLLRNLSDILGDSMSSQELRKLAVGILRNLAIDLNARQSIGRIEVIISRLLHAFLTPDRPSSTDADRFLRKVAGQALAMLAMDSVNNCLAMLRETGYVFVKELTCMIHVDRYRCVAASLLRSMILHARPELKDPDMKELSYSLREVLERILRAEGAELEILIGLSSQISKAIPEEFSRELEHGQIEETFVKRLVDALNANMEPSADCPGIRRVLLEQAINLMEYDSRYVNRFSHCRMAEALSVVEETASEAENWNIFLGDAGLMEADQPLSSLVARAKQLLALPST